MTFSLDAQQLQEIDNWKNMLAEVLNVSRLNGKFEYIFSKTDNELECERILIKYIHDSGNYTFNKLLKAPLISYKGLL